jgi:hypothetical protein
VRVVAAAAVVRAARAALDVLSVLLPATWRPILLVLVLVLVVWWPARLLPREAWRRLLPKRLPLLPLLLLQQPNQVGKGPRPRQPPPPRRRRRLQHRPRLPHTRQLRLAKPRKHVAPQLLLLPLLPRHANRMPACTTTWRLVLLLMRLVPRELLWLWLLLLLDECQGLLQPLRDAWLQVTTRGRPKPQALQRCQPRARRRPRPPATAATTQHARGYLRRRWSAAAEACGAAWPCWRKGVAADQQPGVLMLLLLLLLKPKRLLLLLLHGLAVAACGCWWCCRADPGVPLIAAGIQHQQVWGVVATAASCRCCCCFAATGCSGCACWVLLQRLQQPCHIHF